MTARIDYTRLSADILRKLVAFSTSLDGGAIEPTLRHLVEIRASQINGCALCVDMHIKQATLHGERPLRLHHLVVWHESPLFTPRERAALAWTEALTRLPAGGVPDALYDDVRTQLADKDLSDLTFLVMSINAWNRAGVAFRTVPGSLDEAYGLDKAGLR